MSENTDISIVIPAYNEGDILRELVSRVDKTMNQCCGDHWELLLIDDNSSDNSFEIMNELSKKNSKLRVFHHDGNRGQTGCFKTGFDNAKGKIVITMDGDLQVLPEDIPLFIDKMNNDYDVVNGIREHRKHDFILRFASRIYNLLMLILFNCPVIDASSNFTAFKVELVKKLRLINNDHRYIIPMVVGRGANRIGEVVVQHKDRKSGKSKYRSLTKFIWGGPEITYAWFRIKILKNYNI